MIFDDDILSILVCPDTKQSVRPLKPNELDEINKAISRGAIKKRAGGQACDPIEGGYIREDNTVVYPVRDSIPVFLIDEALVVTDVV